nr:DNA methylase [Nostoc commune]
MSEISSKKIWVVGDRFQSKWDKSIICTLVKIRQAGKKPYTVEWDNKRRVHCDESWFDDMKFLEETECNLHNLTSAQELAQVTVYQDFSTDLSSLEPQRLTITAQTSLNCDIQELTTMETCKVLPIQEHSDCDPDQLISFPLPHPAPHFPQKAIAGEQPMSETVSPQSLKLLASTNQNLQQSKTSQVCSLVPTSLEMSAVTSGTFYSSFPPSGMMRTGLLSEAATLALPSLEKEYCWLPSPGALSFSGKGRPPGQTKQEGGLKDLGLLQKGEVLNPDILCEWYGLPPNWLDPSESRAATELLENNERQQEICLTPELQRSPFVESSTLTQSLNKLTPEIFLEESERAAASTKKVKGRQRKGCLYKYIENKKLKSGAIASYPRVIGHRNPDNPTHWRWGFNWEEKVDGEWKGRSIGSVPLGAIALIQSMQNEGVPLEEIIGFIKRAKAKK